MTADDSAGAAPTPSRDGFGRLTTVGIFVLAGLMVTVSALAARGTDLRADRTSDMRELIMSQAERNEELRAEAADLRNEIDELGGEQEIDADLADLIRTAATDASTLPVAGPGVRVVLDDAPPDVRPADIDDDLLVVHQQDIQAVVNALWAAGAEAMTIQGQRVISTTGIKCVGNSVVLHGIPYAPPYVIEAIGPGEAMLAGLDGSATVQVYRQYVDAFGLGFSQETLDRLEVPAFVGSVNVSEANRTA